MEINTIYFSTRIGEATSQVPFPVAPSLQFNEIIPEIAAKFGIDSQNLAIATAGGGNTLTPTDLLNSVENVVKRYGNQFEIINRGIVGGGTKPIYGWAEGIVDQVVPKFPEKLQKLPPAPSLENTGEIRSANPHALHSIPQGQRYPPVVSAHAVGKSKI